MLRALFTQRILSPSCHLSKFLNSKKRPLQTRNASRKSQTRKPKVKLANETMDGARWLDVVSKCEWVTRVENQRQKDDWSRRVAVHYVKQEKHIVAGDCFGASAPGGAREDCWASKRTNERPAGGVEALGMPVDSEPPRGWDATYRVPNTSLSPQPRALLIAPRSSIIAKAAILLRKIALPPRHSSESLIVTARDRVDIDAAHVNRGTYP